jgi:hypothetical protein
MKMKIDIGKLLEMLINEAPAAPAPVKTPTKPGTAPPKPEKQPFIHPGKPVVIPDGNPGPKSIKPSKKTRENSDENMDEAINWSGRERPNREIEDEIESGDNPLTKDDVFSKETVENMAKERFEKLIAEFKKRSKGDRTDIATVMGALMEKLHYVLSKENGNEDKLEKLAIDLVRTQYNIPQEVKMIAKLVKKPMKKAKGQKIDSEDLEDLDPEEMKEINIASAKRRLMNTMIQGAAVKANQMHNMVSDELGKIDKELVNAYSIIMTSNELSFWLMGRSTISAAAEGSHFGQVEVNFQKDPQEISAKGMIFPVLVHELTKGALEWLFAHGLPKSSKVAKYVFNKEDTITQEIVGLRFGPEIWNKFLDIVNTSKNSDILNAILVNVAARETDRETIDLIKGVVEGTEDGKKRFLKFAKELKEWLEDEKKISAMKEVDANYEEWEEENFNDDDDDQYV